jgi:hypothetical protein
MFTAVSLTYQLLKPYYSEYPCMECKEANYFPIGSKTVAK